MTRPPDRPVREAWIVAALRTPFGRYGGALASVRPDDLAAAVIKALVDAGMFPRSTAGRCEYCDFGYACGITDWTRGRKREHERLEDLVSLQRDGPTEVSDDAGA